jgi:hypothetical protein
MKRLTSLLLVIAFAGAILLPVTAAVNNTYSNQSFSADGGGGKPQPPLPPCLFSSIDTSLSA